MGLPQTLTKRASIDAELTPTYPDVAHLLLDWRPLLARQNDKFGRHRRFVGAALEFVTSGRSVAISSDAVGQLSDLASTVSITIITVARRHPRSNGFAAHTVKQPN